MLTLRFTGVGILGFLLVVAVGQPARGGTRTAVAQCLAVHITDAFGKIARADEPVYIRVRFHVKVFLLRYG